MPDQPTSSAPSASLREVLVRAASYFVEDLHIKGPLLLAGLVMFYGYLVRPETLDACKAYAGWLAVFATGGAVAPKK